MEEIEKKIKVLSSQRYNCEIRIRDLREYVEYLKKRLRSNATNKNDLALQLMVAEDELECDTLPVHKALVGEIADLEKKKAEMASPE